MASISDLPRGRRKIQFTDLKGKRQTVFLGKVTRRNAEGWQLRIEQLVIAQRLQQQPEDDVSKWLSKLSDRMHAKLSRTGLIPPRAPAAVDVATLGPWIDRYIAGRTDAKPATATVWRRTQKHLLAYFGADKHLAAITTADAIEFRLWLLTDLKDAAGAVTRRRLSENTTRRTIGIAKQFLQRAVKAKLIADNPFRDEELPTATIRVDERKAYVTPADAEKVLEACPDAEWRLIFALARYGGLRTPSETFALRWEDVDWSRGRMRVTSPKTEHHAGKAWRTVPLFPELRPHLEAAFEQAPEGAEHVITLHRIAGMNLRTTMEKIVQRAGVPPWPKLFHNLRASRETELCQRFPIHVVCEWIGNSASVAVRHYLQVTEDDFDRAGSPTEQAGEHVERNVERNHERPVQSRSDLERPGASEKSRKRPKNSIKPQKPVKTGWAMRDQHSDENPPENE